ncbi:MAG: hypothetical protein LCH88_05350 [Proteobacteria bacterium]|nr:hypothetical protein [Pseudomonadota bacterium]
MSNENPRVEAEMRALLKAHPRLSANPAKLRTAAEVRVAERDRQNWSKAVAKVSP